MNTFTRDIEKYPALFEWEGAINQDWLVKWLDKRQLSLPKDIIELWLQKGGGTMFETETLLSPIGNPLLGDSVEAITLQHYQNRLSRDYYVIHTGLVLTGIRLSDGNYVVLDMSTYLPVREYLTLESWYINEIRSEYADRYSIE